MKIQIGWATTIIATDDVLSSLMALLMECTDETGERIEFKVEKSKSPEETRQAQTVDAAVDEEWDGNLEDARRDDNGDSCWGFIGSNFEKSESLECARNAIDYLLAEEAIDKDTAIMEEAG